MRRGERPHNTRWSRRRDVSAPAPRLSADVRPSPRLEYVSSADQEAERHLITLAMQYYVAGRCAAECQLFPVAGNLLHHAVEMILKALLVPGSGLSSVTKFGHRLEKSWDAAVLRLPGLDSPDRRRAVEALDRFEQLRYPDGLMKTGAAMRFGWERTTPMPEMNVPVYDLAMEDVDELFAAVFRGTGKNVEFFQLPLNEKARAALRYRNLFPLEGERQMPNPQRNEGMEDFHAMFQSDAKCALRIALDERRFEIDLYWRRAAYFWTLTAAAFVGYFSSLELAAASAIAPFVVSCLGMAFSFAWYCVNRGSKFWQENWERHVVLLEREICGPLHDVTLDRSHYPFRYLHRAYPFSVSRVHQLLSLFVALVWVTLALGSATRLPLTWAWADPTPGIVAILTLGFAFACLKFGGSGEGPVTRDLVERELGVFRLKRPNNALEPTARTDDT